MVPINSDAKVWPVHISRFWMLNLDLALELDLASAPGTMHQAPGTRHTALDTRHQATALHQDAGASCYFYQDADASYHFYQDAGASCYSTTTRTLLFHQDAGWRRQLLYEHFYLSVTVMLKFCLPILCVRLLSLPRFKARNYGTSTLWRVGQPLCASTKCRSDRP